MSVINPFMIKQQAGNVDLSLSADAGKSLLVKDILICNPASSYITVKIDKATVGYFRVGGSLGSHLALPIGSVNHSHSVTVAAADGSLSEDHAITDGHGTSQATLALTSSVSAKTTFSDIVGFSSIPQVSYTSILSKLAQRGIFGGYPIAEGQTLTITGAAQAGAYQIVIYEEATAGDHKSTDENGSDAKTYLLLNYGRVAASITTSTDTVFDTPQTPAEFPDFPFGKDVPSQNQITLYGVLASDIVFDLGSNDSMNSTYLKLISDRITLFDDDRNGLLMAGLTGTTDVAARVGCGYSLIGNDSTVDQKPGLFFNPPIIFNPGDELGIYLSTVAGSSQSSSDLTAALTEICLIEKVTRK